MSSTLTVKPGDKVMILTSGLQEDPNMYRVEDIKRSVVFLTLEGTEKQVKVHRTRIVKIINEENKMNIDENDNDTSTITQDATETVLVDETPEVIKPKAKAPKTPKPKVEPVKVDFTQAPFAGMEIFTKGGIGFDFDGITVQSHCVMLDDGYQTFNTYNGTLGKKGKLPEDGSLPGVHYNFTEKMTSDKKRASLLKKGYELRPDTGFTAQEPEVLDF